MIFVGDWKLHWWDDPIEGSDDFPDYEPTSTLDWTEATWGDPRVAAAIRKMMARRVYGDVFRLPDAAIRRLAARELEFGRIRLQVRRIITEGSVVDAGTESPVILFPLDERKSAASSAPATGDEDLFPENDDLVAMAGVLQDAASGGVPFCEECAKAAAAARGKS